MKPALTVGILTAAPSGARAFRSGGRYRRLARHGLQENIFVYAVLPEWIDVDRRTYQAVPLFLDGDPKRVTLSAFDVIYNRLPTPELEAKHRRLLAELSVLTGGAVFNPRFIDKWTQYVRFAPLRPRLHLPHTERLTAPEDVRRWIGGPFYVKPVSGRMGDGVAFVREDGGTFWVVGTKTRRRYADAGALAQALFQEARRRPMLLQRAVRRVFLDGAAVDLRVLVQKRSGGRFRLTGIGARVGRPGAPTTHVPRGGRIAPVRPLLETLFSPAEAARIVERTRFQALIAAEALDRTFGLRLGELSFDFALAEDGEPWLLEANAKPMAFDETAIERRWRTAFFDTVRHFAAAGRAHRPGGGPRGPGGGGPRASAGSGRRPNGAEADAAARGDGRPPEGPVKTVPPGEARP
ncbi:YheC/YheD family protein [Hydrogenibacillus sp. N12]|uniref:YheC/YheD family endospore coat-associated protein n=1 Tax=Hydrogenibacillus sp. N12 TaxID=2866627 RepID=UPI001C7CD36C|nr:YheC/YheD family protein [Hydrogenibacillus sp. N12]QZA32662.1 YheC/YheD family protein [Hydrogenibacillus sp. N12]